MKQSSFFVVILMALFGLMLTSLFVGNIPWQSLWVQTDIFWFALAHLRLPRTLLAVLAGAGLGVTGAALQGFLRNPLADPGLIGVSSGASLSAVLALSLGFSLATIPFLGIMGAIVTTLFLHQAVSKNKDTLRLILVGLALNSFLSALTALVLNFSKNPYKSLEIMFWLLGSFSDQPLDKVLWAVLPVVIGFWIIYRDRHVLDTLSFGEDFSHNMGHAITTVQKKLIIGIALIVGPIVSLGGIVGFVGLITPHILRQILKVKPSDLLIPSALSGAVLCLLADIGVRFLSIGSEIKIGVVTSFLGAPFFLYLLLKKGKTKHDPYS